MDAAGAGSLIHMCLFFGALTFIVHQSRAASDAEYRSTFLDPLIDDLHTTLIAGNRYRSAIRPHRQKAVNKWPISLESVTAKYLWWRSPSPARRPHVYNSFFAQRLSADMVEAGPAGPRHRKRCRAALLNGRATDWMNDIEKDRRPARDKKKTSAGSR